MRSSLLLQSLRALGVLIGFDRGTRVGVRVEHLGVVCASSLSGVKKAKENQDQRQLRKEVRKHCFEGKVSLLQRS